MTAFKTKYSSLAGAARRLWSLVPAGGSLPEDVWRKRHRFLLGLTWFHAVIIALLGPVLGYRWELSFRAPFRDGTVLHAVAEGLIVALFALLASRKEFSRTVRATLVGFGLISSSAILVHYSGGYIELHFHFFVMLVFMALYQDWVPYGLAVLYVAVHHGVVGVLWPTEVYNHPAAINAPWTWAGIHAFFVLWSCVGSIIAWRFNEVAFAQTKLILDSAGEGVYGLDLDGKTTFVNPAAAKMLGWEVRELIGQPMHDILHHSKADGTPYPREECPIYAAFRDGAAHRVTEEVFWRKDGTSFSVEYLSTPIIERGELTGAVITFMDVTERKRAESARKAAEARFAGILDIAADAIIAVDESQHIILFNKVAEQIFGYSTKEVLGRPLDLLLPSRFAEAHRRHIHGFAAASEPARRMSERREVFGQRRDGTEFPAEASISKLTQDGKTIFTVILRDISERKQAEERTQRNLEGIRALHEIDKAITSTLDLHDILNVLLEKIELFLPYSTATIRLLNKESSLLEPVACRNLDEAEWKVAAWKPGRGPANAVFESKAPLVIRNCLNDPRVKDHEFFRKHRLVSYMGVPMFAKEEILGVLSFYTKEEHEFTAEEVEFLTTLAGQAAIAIHNARLHEETERRRREAEELARVAQSLTETLDMTAVGERIVTSVREILGVEVSTLRLLQPDGSLRTLASTSESFSQTSGEDALPAGIGLASVAIAEGRPVWSADVLNDPEIRLTDQMRDFQLLSGNRSMIAVPLRAHEKIIGSLGLADQTGRTYSDSEVALAQTFADQAALALENARLYEEARTRESRLQETNRMLLALHAVAAAASQSLDLDRVLQAAIEKIIDIFRFDATGIFIYDEQMNELLLRVSLASDRERFTQPQSFTRGQGIVGGVVESGKPLIFEDVQTDPLYQQLSQNKSAKQLGHHFFAVFPVKGKLKNVGALTCMGVAPRRLKSNEIQLLEAVTDQIAVAIENSALYEEMVKLAADLSRSNKVKDEFLSVMSHELRTPLNVVMGYTGMIRDGLLGEINPEQEKALEKVISRARDQLTMISSILQATQMEAEGVKVERREVRLKDFLDDLRSGYAIPLGKEFSLIWDYPSDLPVIHTDGEKLKHVLQNLINNAVKFTARGHVTVSVRVTESSRQNAESSVQQGKDLPTADRLLPTGGCWVEFKVADTGIGIAEEFFPVIFERFRQVDSSETRNYGGVGIGLYIVKKFTEMLGGKIDVESEVGKGSTFTVTIPVADHQGAGKEETRDLASSA